VAGVEVTFRDGEAVIGAGTTNSNGDATFSISSLAGGSHSITAVFAGTAIYQGNTSTPIIQIVNRVHPMVPLISSVNPSYPTQSVTFTATVDYNAGFRVVGEDVTFYDGSTPLGTATTNGIGQATLTTSELALGSHDITAFYPGSVNLEPSTSPVVTQVVETTVTQTRILSALPNPSNYGQSVTFTARVDHHAGFPVVGVEVTFKDGTTILGIDTTDDNGYATFSTPALTEGSHSITAVFAGTARYLDSTSSVLTQVVDGTAPNTQIDSQPDDPISSPDATFYFSSPDDPAATFECRLDGGGYYACTSPKEYTGLANGPHTFDVQAKDAAGNVDPTPAAYTWIVDIPLPVAFNKSSPADSATGVSLTGTSLNWEDSAGATSYEYCIDTISDGWCNTSWISTGTQTSVTLSNLSTTTTYYWQVRARNSTGTTYADNSVNSYRLFTTQGRPEAFGKTDPLHGVTGQVTTPTLSWETSAGAASYEYCIDTISDGWCNTSWISTGTQTSVTLSNLSALITYYWQVRARNSAGSTPADISINDYWSFTTQGKPEAFGKTDPLSGATDQVINPTLSWEASTGATSYEYCIDTISDPWCNTSWISTGPQTSVTLSNLSTTTTYYWQVRARNSLGITLADSATFWSFTTQGKPAAFGKTTPLSGATGQTTNPTLTWGASTGATSYEYCLDVLNDGWCNTSWITTGTQTSVALSNLSPLTAYYWQVRARNSSGTTPAENSINYYWSFATQ